MVRVVRERLGFACTFLARPFGGLFIGLLGDVFGRKVSAFVSIFGMLIGHPESSNCLVFCRIVPRAA